MGLLNWLVQNTEAYSLMEGRLKVAEMEREAIQRDFAISMVNTGRLLMSLSSARAKNSLVITLTEQIVPPGVVEKYAYFTDEKGVEIHSDEEHYGSHEIAIGNLFMKHNWAFYDEDGTFRPIVLNYEKLPTLAGRGIAGVGYVA